MRNILTLSLLLATVLAAPLDADAIRLRSDARLDHRSITLADVATLEGAAAVALADVSVATVEAGHDRATIELHDLRRLLEERGVNAGDVTLAGHAACRVMLLPRDTAANDAPHGLDARETNASDPTPPNATTTPAQSLRSLVRSRLAAMAGVDADALIIEYTADDLARLDRADSTSTAGGGWEVQSHSTSGLGTVPLTLRAWDGTRAADRLTVTARVSHRVRAVIPVRNIARGEPVTQADIQLREMDLTRTVDDLATRPDEVIGRVATRPLTDGEPFSGDHLRAPLAVRRGDLVTVRARSGSLVVKTVARALADAPAGETIALRNEVTRETFQATVVGDREASVDTAS